MQQEQYKRYIEEQNGLFNRMQEIQSAAEEAGDWSAEQRTNWDAANERITEVSAKIEEHEADVRRAERMRELDSVDYSKVVDGRDVTGDGAPEDRAKAQDEAYNRAFATYMRHGLDRLDTEQRKLMMANFSEDRAQGTTTGAAGGYLIPPGYRAVMTEAMKAYGGLINHANVITTATGNPLQWPTNDDTGNVGAILAENSQIAEQAVTLGTKTIGAYVYTSKLVLVSLQLLQDSVFDLDTWLPRKLGERIGRGVAPHLISGNGTTQPEGIATNAVAGVTGAAGFGITYDNIVDLEHSVDPAYRGSGNCRFLFNDGVLAILRKLKDSQNRPLWLPVPVPGMPATINGQPYTIDQGMPAPGANAKPILFGNFHAAYIVRQVLDTQMVRLAERYADFLQVGFFGFTRLDAKADDANAVRAFQNGAT